MIISWLAKHYVEVLGSVAGIVYLFFSIRQKIWLWLVGLISCFLYIFVFYNAKFYAGMALQVYYVFISMYGWYYWKKGSNSTEKRLKTVIASPLEWIIFIAATAILTLIIGTGLDKFTDSPLPFWDAFTTSGSIVATFMLARKYLENWIFWIVIDIVSLGIYLYRSLYPTVVLFAVYTGMAFIGYIKWKKDLEKVKT